VIFSTTQRVLRRGGFGENDLRERLKEAEGYWGPGRDGRGIEALRPFVGQYRGHQVAAFALDMGGDRARASGARTRSASQSPKRSRSFTMAGPVAFLLPTTLVSAGQVAV